MHKTRHLHRVNKENRSHKSKRHEKHIHIKPEPLDSDEENEHTSKHHREPYGHDVKCDDNYGPSAKRLSKRRLNEPEIIKEFPESRKRRIDSSVLLEERKPIGPNNQQSAINQALPNLGKSGMLEKRDTKPIKIQKADFGLSGKLTADTNTYKGVVIKYNEPADAKKPIDRWRLYAFKGNKQLSILHIHRQSGFLIGRDRKIADIPMDHPSISKQHAVLQYRHVRGVTRLYIIDLESANGTYLNNSRIEPRKYIELLEKDVIKFGFSTREYVVMTADTGTSGSEDM